MSVFRYHFGCIYVVIHPKKGYWNNDKKKYVSNFMKATFYKNKKCAQKKAKELGRSVKYYSFRIECPDWW